MTAVVTDPGKRVDDDSGELNVAVLKRNARNEVWGLLGLCSPSLFLVGLIIILPVGWLFWLSLYDENGMLSFVNYERFVEQSSYVKTFVTTFEVSFGVTAICILLGYPLAYMLSQIPRRAASICMILVILPFWTSVLVRTYAWLVILQRKGLVNDWLIDLGIINQPLALVNNFTGVLIGMTHIMLPFLVLPLYASMKSISADYQRAGMNLGAGPVATFWQIFFPLSLPGLAAGVVITFVLCLGFFVTPALMGGGKVIMWAMRMQQTTSLYANWGAGSALGVLLLAVTFGLLGFFNWLLRGQIKAAWGGK
ncbi:MAG: ABC transporter permease [Rhodospirillaceae bacterium]|nr:MAG: ABC transporter permease [Rhodospirillaceae bacterium]